MFDRALRYGSSSREAARFGGTEDSTESLVILPARLIGVSASVREAPGAWDAPLPSVGIRGKYSPEVLLEGPTLMTERIGKTRSAGSAWLPWPGWWSEAALHVDCTLGVSTGFGLLLNKGTEVSMVVGGGSAVCEGVELPGRESARSRNSESGAKSVCSIECELWDASAGGCE